VEKVELASSAIIAPDRYLNNAGTIALPPCDELQDIGTLVSKMREIWPYGVGPKCLGADRVVRKLEVK
jgi:hypothetical protein